MSNKSPQKIIQEFEECAKEMSWLGAKHPGDHAEIQMDYHRKKAALYKLVGLTYEIPEED